MDVLTYKALVDSTITNKTAPNSITPVDEGTMLKDGIDTAILRSNHVGTQLWSTITSTPTTIAGYGITDYNSLWDTRFSTKDTDDLTEGSTNLYFTNARARSAISLTTTGSSGPATYSSSTGVLNIPQYSGNPGTVTSVSATDSSELDFTVTNPTSTPNITASIITGSIANSKLQNDYIGFIIEDPFSPTNTGPHWDNILVPLGGAQILGIPQASVVGTISGLISHVEHTNFTTGFNHSLVSAAFSGGVLTLIRGDNTDITATLDDSDIITVLGYTPEDEANKVIDFSTIDNITYPTTDAVVDYVAAQLSGSGFVPNSRTLTINGTAFDLSANRSWSVGTVTTVGVTDSSEIDFTVTSPTTTPNITASLIAGSIANSKLTNSSISFATGSTGTAPNWSASPVSLGGTATINVPLASGSGVTSGTISKAEYDNFTTAYTNRITSLTTTGSSGASTLISNTLNIPTYTLAGLGGVPTTTTVNGHALSSNVVVALDELDQVVITSPTSGDVLSYDGANWVNIPATGGGTVTSVSVVSANGFAGSVANATTTPAITLSTSITGILKGNGTAISAATAGTDYTTPSSTETVTNKDLTSGTNTFPTFNQNTTGSAATLTTTRTIWGQNFNGSANVTGNLTLGTADLTMTGSLAATGARVTKGWFTDIESTNVPTVGGVALPTASSTTTFTNKTLTSSTNVLGGVTMTLGSDATGDIYYRDAGGLLTRLGVGSNGDILTVASGLPSWAAPGAGSGTVTSVDLTVPSWLTVTGNPITTSGTLAVAATTGQTANRFLATPDGSTGAVSLRAIVAADVPTLNQNTTGSAATLTTARAIYGNNFDGSAALTQIIASTFGGTGNGFTKFTGPATSEKTFTLPNATATILTDNAAVTVPQGGTGNTTFTAYSVICAGTTATGTFQNVSGVGTSGQVLTSNGASALPTWQTPSGGGSYSLLFTQTANADVNNTAAETTLIGTGTGSATFTANLLTAGKTFRVIQKGFISTTSPADTCNLRVKIGGTTVSTIAIDTSSMGASQTNVPYFLEYLIVCRTTGASGTVMITGTITYPVPTAFGIPTPVVQAIGSSSTVTVNTTGTLANDITADWANAANGRRVLSTITTIEQLN